PGWMTHTMRATNPMFRSTKATFGSANAWNSPSVTDMWNGTSEAPQMPGEIGPFASRPGVGADGGRPAPHELTSVISALTLGARRSTAWICTADSALTLTASRTAFSAQSALRSHRSASERMNAAASFVTFSCSMAPETPTGWAAPMFVPGAMALIGQAIMMNVPADAARAPDGAV